MQDVVRCPSCGMSLRVSGDVRGRRVRCANCQTKFAVGDKSDDSGVSFSDEIPVLNVPPHREETLSRSMLPGRVAPVVPPDEMLARLEPHTLRWLHATAALEKFLGQTVDRLRARTFPEFIHPDDRALAEDEFRKAVEIGERHDFVLRFPDAQGRMRFVRVYTQARYNQDGTINHVRCYLKDVTERVQAEQELRRRTEQLTDTNEQLRQTNRKLKETQGQLVHSEKLAALGTLAAGMAHEINNPLAFAMNNVAVMARDIGDLLRLVALYEEAGPDLSAARPELAARVDRLREEADLPYLRDNLPRMADATRQGLQRVAKIVENLRGFAQIDRAEVAMVDLNESLEHTLAMMADTLAQERVTVERRFTPLPLLECAAAPMNQVFLNLLMNAFQAIRATGRGSGRIGLATRVEGGVIVVEVSDDGSGIAPDVLPRIFDPFYTTKPVGQGTGLGLSLSHGIVAEHGGRIEVESTVGQGSLFRIRLPLHRPAPRAGAPATS